MKRVLPPTYLFGAIVLMAFLHFLLPLRVVIVFPWRLIGILPLVAGIGINLAADRAFKERGTTVKPYEASTAFITDGVFRFSRNPMYLGMTASLLGIAILLGTATPFAIVPVFAVASDRVFIVPEERMLEQAFGDEFRQYRNRVRRWI